MKIHDVDQGSPEWFKLRAGIITASELDAIITPAFKLRDSHGVDAYAARKIAERWTGSPLQTFSGGSMEQGTILETEAIPWLSFETSREIRRVGFITTDDGSFGCSPDGLMDDGGLEVKCPEPHTHVRYLIDGGVPNAYVAQVQGAMYATGAKWWMFVSYCRGFPNLVVTAHRTHEAMIAIEAAVRKTNAKIEAGYAKLVEANGGEPRRGRARKFKTPVDYSASAVDEELLQKLY